MKFAQFHSMVQSILTPDSSGGFKEKYSQVTAENLSPLVLAYIGDAYFNIYVRMRLLHYEQNKVQILHSFGAQIVSAVWQTEAYHAIAAELTAEEKDVFRRGRNARSHVPKSATVAEYRISTGFEALLGALYVRGELARLEELADKSFATISHRMVEKAQGKGDNGNAD